MDIAGYCYGPTLPMHYDDDDDLTYLVPPVPCGTTGNIVVAILSTSPRLTPFADKFSWDVDRDVFLVFSFHQLVCSLLHG